VETVRRYSDSFEREPAAVTGRDYTIAADSRAADRRLPRAKTSNGRGRSMFAGFAVAAGAGVVVLGVLIRWPLGVSRDSVASARSANALDAEKMPLPKTSEPAHGEAATTGSAAPAAPAGSAAPTAPTAPNASIAPAAGDADVLRLDLQPRGSCWISATADGKRSVYRLMQSSDRETVEARDEVVLRVGDPANFGFMVNGVPGKPLGPAGEATTVRITRENYHQWLAR